jgi:hypothetical protein
MEEPLQQRRLLLRYVRPHLQACQTGELKNSTSFGKDDLMELSKPSSKAHDRVLDLIHEQRKDQAQGQSH